MIESVYHGLIIYSIPDCSTFKTQPASFHKSDLQMAEDWTEPIVHISLVEYMLGIVRQVLITSATTATMEVKSRAPIRNRAREYQVR
jgi:hypothetical protein